jgi:hypothetical protein
MRKTLLRKKIKNRTLKKKMKGGMNMGENTGERAGSNPYYDQIQLINNIFRTLDVDDFNFGALTDGVSNEVYESEIDELNKETDLFLDPTKIEEIKEKQKHEAAEESGLGSAEGGPPAGRYRAAEEGKYVGWSEAGGAAAEARGTHNRFKEGVGQFIELIIGPTETNGLRQLFLQREDNITKPTNIFVGRDGRVDRLIVGKNLQTIDSETGQLISSDGKPSILWMIMEPIKLTSNKDLITKQEYIYGELVDENFYSTLKYLNEDGVLLNDEHTPNTASAVTGRGVHTRFGETSTAVSTYNDGREHTLFKYND